MIQTAAGIGMSLMSGEHFFSTFLSSPWTTEKFASTPEDKEKVRRLFWMATACSIAVGAILGYILKQWWPLLSSLALIAIYYYIYEKALRGEI